MPKGKAGPRPEMIVTSEAGVRVIEEDFIDENGPTAEEIVGKENVVDVGPNEQLPDEKPSEPQSYKCTACSFRSNLLSEMEEHVNGTGHGGYGTERRDTPIVQPELFSSKGIIHRHLEKPIEESVLNQKRAKLAELYQCCLDVRGDKKAADEKFNNKLKGMDEQMQEIARLLAAPNMLERVECEWRIIDGENARGLYRMDTGELVEKQALTQEDRNLRKPNLRTLILKSILPSKFRAARTSQVRKLKLRKYYRPPNRLLRLTN